MSYTPPFYKKPFHSFRRFIANKWLSNMPVLQIAVTGSQGKTTTTNIIHHLLKIDGPTVCTDINLDTTYNVPITALKVAPWTHYALFELGVDHPFEMDQHLEIVKPKIAVVTGISPVHTDQEHFGSLENLIKEKRKLIETLPSNGYALLNGDDKNIREMAPFTKANVIFYGKNGNNDISASDILISLTGTSFVVSWNNKKGQLPLEKPLFVETQLIGAHNIYSILASLSVIFAVHKILRKKTDFRPFLEIIKRLKPLSGRMSVEKGPMDTMVLNDSLRANPASTASGLYTLSSVSHPGAKIAVLAEMGELMHPEEEHGKIGSLLSKLKIDQIVLIGNLHKHTLQKALDGGFPADRIHFAQDVIEASNLLKPLIRKGDLIYLKGSLLRHVERVLMKLNGENVKCQIGICPFYHHCLKCEYKEHGYV